MRGKLFKVILKEKTAVLNLYAKRAFVILSNAYLWYLFVSISSLEEFFTFILSALGVHFFIKENKDVFIKINNKDYNY